MVADPSDKQSPIYGREREEGEGKRLVEKRWHHVLSSQREAKAKKKKRKGKKKRKSKRKGLNRDTDASASHSHKGERAKKKFNRDRSPVCVRTHVAPRHTT